MPKGIMPGFVTKLIIIVLFGLFVFILFFYFTASFDIGSFCVTRFTGTINKLMLAASSTSGTTVNYMPFNVEKCIIGAYYKTCEDSDCKKVPTNSTYKCQNSISKYCYKYWEKDQEKEVCVDTLAIFGENKGEYIEFINCGTKECDSAKGMMTSPLTSGFYTAKISRLQIDCEGA